MTTTAHDPWNGTFTLICRELPIGKIDLTKTTADYRAARTAASAKGRDFFRAWIKQNPTPKAARIKDERKDARTTAWEQATLARITATPKVVTPEPIKISHAEEVAQQRAALFAKALSPCQAASTGPRDARLPAAGTILTRKHKGTEIKVEVLGNGFRYDGRFFASLSAISNEITGSSTNGFRWFNLAAKEV